MPRPGLSSAMSQAMLARETSEEIVVLLTISHPNFVTPIRRALRRTALVSRGETYFPQHFAPSFPSQDGEGFQNWQIVIDGVAQDILTELRAVSMPKPTCIVEVVRASAPDTVEITTGSGYEVQEYSWNWSTLTLEIGLPSLSQEGYPGGRIGPNNFPGGF